VGNPRDAAATDAAAADGITERHHTARRVMTLLDQMIVMAADHPDATRPRGADHKSDVMRPNRNDAGSGAGGGSPISGEGNGRGRTGAAISGAREHHVGENGAPGAALPGRIRAAVAL